MLYPTAGYLSLLLRLFFCCLLLYFGIPPSPALFLLVYLPLSLKFFSTYKRSTAARAAISPCPLPFKKRLP